MSMPPMRWRIWTSRAISGRRPDDSAATIISLPGHAPHPFNFYYRRLEVTGASATSVQRNWLPSSKMEVKNPTHEVYADHEPLLRPGSYLLPALFKSRLFLFIPQITRQTTQAAPPDTSIMAAANNAWASRPLSSIGRLRSPG
ncbi:hypothetical protein QBC43DRAFT_292867 [Cladorrhinum sp. PSN259]|nr:hypothetical protein QBC43DRAFT_292867 [Cladorrhinum sp. PSN259]